MENDYTLRSIDNGKILHFSIKDFEEKIVKSNNCFICGQSPDDKIFNDEHIIPKWILRKFDLYNQK